MRDGPAPQGSVSCGSPTCLGDCCKERSMNGVSDQYTARSQLEIDPKQLEFWLSRSVVGSLHNAVYTSCFASLLPHCTCRMTVLTSLASTIQGTRFN